MTCSIMPLLFVVYGIKQQQHSKHLVAIVKVYHIRKCDTYWKVYYPEISIEFGYCFHFLIFLLIADIHIRSLSGKNRFIFTFREKLLLTHDAA